MSQAHECLQRATPSSTPPYQDPVRAWAGRGSGAACSMCGGAIGADQIEYEVELESSATERLMLCMHLECYQGWAARA